MAVVLSWLATPAAAVDIDSNVKVVELLRNPGFAIEFARFSRTIGRKAMYIAVDETGIAFGSRESFSMSVLPRWVHDEAKQACLKDRQNRGVKTSCTLFIEDDRFVHTGITLSPTKLVSSMRSPPQEKAINQHHWQPPEPGIIRLKREAKPVSQGKTVPEIEVGKEVSQEKVTAQDLREITSVSKREEKDLFSIEDPKRLFVDLAECVDADGKVKPGFCGVPTAEAKHLAMLKSIKPVTTLSEKQLRDLIVLSEDRRFRRFVQRYFQSPQQKAMALAVDGKLVATGLVTGLRRSRDRIAKLALAECRENRIRKKIESGCFVYLQNDEFLYPAAGIAP